jgi:hypothetical protein
MTTAFDQSFPQILIAQDLCDHPSYIFHAVRIEKERRISRDFR